MPLEERLLPETSRRLLLLLLTLLPDNTLLTPFSNKGVAMLAATQAARVDDTPPAGAQEAGARRAILNLQS